MKKVYVSLTVLVVLMGSIASEASAQKNWTWYIANIVQGSGPPDFIDVQIGVRANSASDVGQLGNNTLRGTMSAALFDFGGSNDPLLQVNHLANYSMTLTDGPGTNVWQRNCTYDGGGSAEVTEGGIVVSTLRFFISDPAGTSSITLGSLQQTFEDDNVTQATVSYDNSGGDVPLPITLASFSGVVNPDGPGVLLQWKTLSEVNNYGFYVQRRLESEEEFSDIPDAFLPGHGTTAEPHDYSYVDGTGPAGKREYRLKQVDLDKTLHYSEPIAIDVLTDVEDVAPPVFVLFQNYPNPFNPATEVKFSVETTGPATVRLYNVAGQEVRTLFEGTAEVGRYYRIELDGRNLASGIYIYRLRTETHSDIKKMVLLK
jgi:hypothetical protein